MKQNEEIAAFIKTVNKIGTQSTLEVLIDLCCEDEDYIKKLRIDLETTLSNL